MPTAYTGGSDCLGSEILVLPLVESEVLSAGSREEG